MNPVGIHALVFAGDWSEPEATRVIEGAAAAGFDLVEIPLLDPGSVDVEMTRRLLERSGLGVACSLGLTSETELSSEDPATVARGEHLLERALETAHALGAELVTGIIYGSLGHHAHAVTKAGRANAVAALERLAGRAAEQGINLGLEVVNRYESNLLNTAEQAVDLIEQIGADNLVVHLDSYHMNIEEDSLESAVVAAGPRLGYVHVGENHRGYLGSGHVDFPRLFEALAQIGYAGAITFESFSAAVVKEGLSDTLSIWREMWSDGDDLARHARRFIAEQLRATSAAAGV
jgi:D-psicose/D-tagatose/L-ribulose 3-epimerase